MTTATATVYGVFTMGTDYYDSELVLHTLYADPADADRLASELRAMTEAEYGCPDEPLYSLVEVQALTVR
jgi:hypothetical protein